MTESLGERVGKTVRASVLLAVRLHLVSLLLSEEEATAETVKRVPAACVAAAATYWTASQEFAVRAAGGCAAARSSSRGSQGSPQQNGVDPVRLSDSYMRHLEAELEGTGKKADQARFVVEHVLRGGAKGDFWRSRKFAGSVVAKETWAVILRAAEKVSPRVFSLKAGSLCEGSVRFIPTQLDLADLGPGAAKLPWVAGAQPLGEAEVGDSGTPVAKKARTGVGAKASLKTFLFSPVVRK